MVTEKTIKGKVTEADYFEYQMVVASFVLFLFAAVSFSFDRIGVDSISTVTKLGTYAWLAFYFVGAVFSAIKLIEKR